MHKNLFGCTRLAVWLALLGLLALPNARVSAHQPQWGEEQGVTPVPDLRTSYAFYRELQAAPPGWLDPTADPHGMEAAAQARYIHIYRFAGRAGQDLHAGIIIPAIRGLEDYGVTLALIGPGLPAPDPGESALPLALPDPAWGARVFPSQPSPDFFEPFTQTNYWGRQDADLTLPADGTYYLVVWNPEGRPGKYVMDTGRAEVFSPADFLRFPVWWVQVHLFFGHGQALVSAAGLGLLLIAALMWRRRRVQSQANGMRA